jgi:hypothetical protein
MDCDVAVMWVDKSRPGSGKENPSRSGEAASKADTKLPVIAAPTSKVSENSSSQVT